MPGYKPIQSFTPAAHLDVEVRIEADQHSVAEGVANSSFAKDVEAVVMIGGYARGEGGYWRDNLGTRAYNDYDYFVVLSEAARSRLKPIREELSKLGRELDKLVGVEVDFFPLLEADIKKLPFTLMYAEMQAGHRVILGRSNILEEMPPMPLERVAASEFKRLMLNRGALLLLNQTAAQAADDLDLDLFNRYLNKAILACGDALLYRYGCYHISYIEKAERLATLEDGAQILPLYRRAVAQKFEPQSARLERGPLERLQLEVERLWLSEFENLKLHGAGERQTLLSRLKSLAVNLRDFGVLGVLQQPAFAFVYPRERLYQLLPQLLSNETKNLKQDERCQNFFDLWARYS